MRFEKYWTEGFQSTENINGAIQTNNFNPYNKPHLQ